MMFWAGCNFLQPVLRGAGHGWQVAAPADLPELQPWPSSPRLSGPPAPLVPAVAGRVRQLIPQLQAMFSAQLIHFGDWLHFRLGSLIAGLSDTTGSVRHLPVLTSTGRASTAVCVTSIGTLGALSSAEPACPDHPVRLLAEERPASGAGTHLRLFRGEQRSQILKFGQANSSTAEHRPTLFNRRRRSNTADNKTTTPNEIADLGGRSCPSPYPGSRSPCAQPRARFGVDFLGGCLKGAEQRFFLANDIDETRHALGEVKNLLYPGLGELDIVLVRAVIQPLRDM